MDFWIVDKNFQNLCICDTFETAIWTDRWSEAGEFQITIRGDSIQEFIQIGNYLTFDQSDHVMVIETIYDTRDQYGRQTTFSGRSLESILDRRIVVDYNLAVDNLRSMIQMLVNKNAINPTNTARTLPLSWGTVQWSDLDYAGQLDVEWSNLYDLIQDFATSYKKGLLVKYVGTTTFQLNLLDSTDRSYNQTANIPVIFSFNYENLTASQFIESDKDSKNTSYAIYERTRYETDSDGNRQDIEERFVEEVGTYSGLNRRETAIEVRLEEDSDNPLSESQIRQSLREEATANLEGLKPQSALSGDIEAYRQFVYGRDFFLGDIVEMEAPDGRTLPCVVGEIVFSQDQNGVETVTPTFLKLEDD